jgi:hypothetical protein
MTRLERFLASASCPSRGYDGGIADSLDLDERDALKRGLPGAVAAGDCLPLRRPAPRLHRKGAAAPPVAPQVTEVVTGPDALATLRRYSPSGVPLDMPAFLALLGDLFGWPPPGAIVDRRHREALIDLYERVYEA